MVLEYLLHLYFFIISFDAAAHIIAGEPQKRKEQSVRVQEFLHSGKDKKGIARVSTLGFGNGRHTWLQGVIT